MRLKFNGSMEKNSKGCPVCGGRHTEYRFTTTRSFYLPSGSMKTFRAGQTYDVTERDGEFLLTYRYMVNGKEKHAFEVV